MQKSKKKTIDSQEVSFDEKDNLKNNGHTIKSVQFDALSQPIIPNLTVLVPGKQRCVTLKNVKHWLEFEQLWRSLQSSDKVECLQTMKPSKFTEMHKHGMEYSDLLLDIVLHCFKMKKKRFNYIRALSKIPSIDMLVIMLSK